MGDEKTTALVQEARTSGFNYILKAAYQRGFNDWAADELAPILNQASQSDLYSGGKRLDGAIASYEEDGGFSICYSR